MPSVRVRRNTYLSLDDPFQDAESSGQALSLDAAGDPAPVPSETQPRPGLTRPRAYSRVVRHVQSLKFPPARPDEDQPSSEMQRLSSRTSSQRLEPGRLEGRQIALSIRSGQEGQPGLVGGALNRSSDNIDDIHDDVVEHLDVIGEYRQLSDESWLPTDFNLQILKLPPCQISPMRQTL
jgi:hypothetical protein